MILTFYGNNYLTFLKSQFKDNFIFKIDTNFIFVLIWSLTVIFVMIKYFEWKMYSSVKSSHKIVCHNY